MLLSISKELALSAISGEDGRPAWQAFFVEARIIRIYPGECAKWLELIIY